MGDGMTIRAFRVAPIVVAITLLVPAVILPMTRPALADECDALQRRIAEVRAKIARLEAEGGNNYEAAKKRRNDYLAAAQQKMAAAKAANDQAAYDKAYQEWSSLKSYDIDNVHSANYSSDLYWDVFEINNQKRQIADLEFLKAQLGCDSKQPRQANVPDPDAGPSTSASATTCRPIRRCRPPPTRRPPANRPNRPR
jgi:hypothetical protein